MSYVYACVLFPVVAYDKWPCVLLLWLAYDAIGPAFFLVAVVAIRLNTKRVALIWQLCRWH